MSIIYKYTLSLLLLISLMGCQEQPQGKVGEGAVKGAKEIVNVCTDRGSSVSPCGIRS